MERPVAGVMAIVRKHGQFLLVRRSKAPDAGRWSFPAGKIERGETLGEAALRELSEETGIVARFGKVLTAVDAIEYDAGGDLRFHFVIVAARCDWQAGDPQPGDDALEARWFTPEQIRSLDLATGFDIAAILNLALDQHVPA
jgi:ADP-ribose pyrophosphatase